MRALFFMNCNYKKGFSKAYAHAKLIIKKNQSSRICCPYLPIIFIKGTFKIKYKKFFEYFIFFLSFENCM